MTSLASISASVAERRGCRGVRDFLKQDVGHNVPFKPPPPLFPIDSANHHPVQPYYCIKRNTGLRKPKLITSSKGLKLGTIVDAMITSRIRGNMAPKGIHKQHTTYFNLFFQLLKDVRLKPVYAQVLAAQPQLRVRTEIDVVAQTPAGKLVVIEVKCTQFSHAEHTSKYHVVPSGVPKTLKYTNLPNTEYNWHALQAAFGALSVAQRLNKPIDTMVAVICRDGAELYMVPPHLVAESSFGTSGTTPISPRAASTRIPKLFNKWPVTPPTSLINALTDTGVSIREPVPPSWLGSALYRNPSSTVWIIIGLTHRARAKVPRKARTLLKVLAMQIGAKNRGAVVKSILICREGSQTHRSIIYEN